MAEGVLPPGRRLPGDRLMYGFYNRFGETVPFIGLARAAARVMRGRSVEATRRAGKRAVEPLVDLVQPWALEVLAVHRPKGRALVLATTSPVDLVSPLAEALGFDDVVATRYGEEEGRYTGRLEGPFVWGVGKRRPPRAGGRNAPGSTWPPPTPTRTASSTCPSCGPSAIPTPSTPIPVWWPWPWPAGGRSSTGTGPPASPHWSASSPTTWCARSSGPRPSPTPASRSRAWSTSRGTGRCSWPPTTAATSTWPPSVSWPPGWAGRCGSWPSRRSSTPRSWVAWPGPSVASRSSVSSDRPVEPSPMRQAAAALRAGEVVIVLPQGTIPAGRPSSIRCSTAAPARPAWPPRRVPRWCPSALWGTERVWPRSSRVPDMTALVHPPEVTVTVGCPVALGLDDAVADTALDHGGHQRPVAGRGPGGAHPDRGGAGPDAAAGVTVTARPPRRALPGARRRGGGGGQGVQLAVPCARPGPRDRGGGPGRAGHRPGLLATLAEGRPVALVTGTNGKTTTTRMLVAALAGGQARPIASNDTGANMPAGHVAALVGSPPTLPPCSRSTRAIWDGSSADTRPRVVVLLNLSRDQLDRISEVRMLVERWKEALGSTDPMPGGDGPTGGGQCRRPDGGRGPARLRRRWCGSGPARSGATTRSAVPSAGAASSSKLGGGWACDRCGFARPRPDAWVEGSVSGADGRVPALARHRAARAVQPGQRGHGRRGRRLWSTAMARTSPAGPARCRAPSTAWPGSTRWPADSRPPSAGVTSAPPAGQEPGRLDGHLRPAGGSAARPTLPVVLSVNARTADGLDTSWLWDVPFERLAGRAVVATGDRRLDLAVRLHYAGVPHTVVADPGRSCRPGHRRRPGTCPGPCHRLPRQLHRLRRTAAPGCEPGRPQLGAGRRRRLPRPARYLRGRRQRPGAGPPGGVAGHRRRAHPGRVGPAPPDGRHLLHRRGRGRPPGAGGRVPPERRRLRSGRGGGRRGAGGLRRLPAARPELPRQPRPAPRRSRAARRDHHARAPAACRGGAVGRGRHRSAPADRPTDACPRSPGSRTTAAAPRSDRTPGRWPRWSGGSATGPATGPRGPGPTGCSAPISTGRSWPATRPWPTSCSGGPCPGRARPRWPWTRSTTARRRRSGANAWPRPSGRSALLHRRRARR